MSAAGINTTGDAAGAIVAGPVDYVPPLRPGTLFLGTYSAGGHYVEWVADDLGGRCCRRFNTPEAAEWFAARVVVGERLWPVLRGVGGSA